ncbi:MAG: rhamnulokinase [Bifidobacteriaceae bacterium]|jgi:rhamnulokinase|nr:rhamnulokinase [Bifidobacteriaceae bacterium]
MPTIPSTPAQRIAAVDLGASSGRVMVVTLGEAAVDLECVHRFPTAAAMREGRLSWDFEGIWANVAAGLRAAAAGGPVDSVGIDSWGVDYGLIGADGELLAAPVSYRDSRTEGVPERVWRQLDPAWLYRLTGTAHQRFNTIFQLATEPAKTLERAQSLLMLPDLLNHRLTGRLGAEATNASTTGLFDAARRDWCWPVIEAMGLPERLFPAVVEPGAVVGELTAQAAEATGLDRATTVVAVGSHDTASAIAAAPATEADFAYISSGTWSLVGVELAEPVLTEASRVAGFTNELGVGGAVRYLKNVTGLWLLSECQRAWAARGLTEPLEALLEGAARLPRSAVVFDASRDQFLAPGDMPERVAEAIVEAGGRAPRDHHETVRCVIDSLAATSAATIRAGAELAGVTPRRIHVVGGGSLNALLNQATADAAGLPVLAGPVEASAIGNALIQARALAAGPAGRARPAGPDGIVRLRRLVAQHFRVRTHQPGGACLPGASQPKEEPS